MSISYFQNHSKFLAISGSLVLILLTAVLDYFTGLEYELSIIYILPIFIASWFVSGRWGTITAVLCVFAWLYADAEKLQTSLSSPVIYWNAGVKLGIFLLTVILFSKIKSQQYQLSKLIGQDPLTGLANRRSFYDAANMEIHKARRFSSAFTVAYIDVDDFKKINDQYGHNTGDAVLRRIATTMRQNTRIVDVVARIGGDEFVILFPETDAEDAKIAVQKVRNLLSDAMQAENFAVTFSIGVVTFREAPISLDVMIEMVDRAMYTVKQSAKNNVLYQKSQSSLLS